MNSKKMPSDSFKELFEKDLFDDPNEELKRQGIYYITNEVVSDSLLTIQQDILLKHLDPNWRNDIQIFINTVGGDCAEGWALIDLIQNIRMNVRTIGIGECLSLGSCLLSSGTNGYRFATKNCTIMIHGAQWENFLDGDRNQIVAKFRYVDQEHKKDLRFWQEHSKYKTPSLVKKYLLNGKDLYLTPKEALKHGIIDRIIGESNSTKDNE